MGGSSVSFSIYRLHIRFQKTRICLNQKLSRVIIAFQRQKNRQIYFGRQHFGLHIWVGTSSSTNIVKLPRRRVDTARALVDVLATDETHTRTYSGL
jgi:hypothetical protein